METLTISIINREALSILKGMERAGLIILTKKELNNTNLSKRLRGSISGSRAKEMIDTIDKDRTEWEARY